MLLYRTWAERIRRPRLIPDAIILAIYGYHFCRTCEKHVVQQ
jgi:hypothetical protein